MTRRFYVEPGTLFNDRMTIEGPLAHRLGKVLRLRAGEQVAIFDGSGDEALVRLEDVGDRQATGIVIARYAGRPEPRVKLQLFQSITKGERFEWLLEKGTEIGVAGFVPLIAARAVVRTPVEGNRIDRWRRIVVEAAEQCGRSVLPSLAVPLAFTEAVRSAPGLLILPYEEAGPEAPNIQAALDEEIDALFALGEVSIFIGPEGGYEPLEIEAAKAAGAKIVTMGERVLRSETAGLVAATVLLFAVGELG